MTQFTLNPPPDFHYLPTVLSHGWCTLPPFSYDEQGTLTRVQKLPSERSTRGGQIVRFSVRAQGEQLVVSSTAKLTGKDKQEIGAVVARCLSFDHDLAPFHALIRSHATHG